MLRNLICTHLKKGEKTNLNFFAGFILKAIHSIPRSSSELFLNQLSSFTLGKNRISLPTWYRIVHNFI